MRYELIDHTADVGIRVFAGSPEELFADAGLVLFELITDTARLAGGESVLLEVEGADWPDLMVNWLRELLFLWSGRGMLVTAVDVTAVCETRVCATIRAARFDPGRHPIKNEIKAVTYHQAAVTRGPTGWSAVVIFDV